jgi:hypothetical protein
MDLCVRRFASWGSFDAGIREKDSGRAIRAQDSSAKAPIIALGSVWVIWVEARTKDSMAFGLSWK